MKRRSVHRASAPAPAAPCSTLQHPRGQRVADPDAGLQDARKRARVACLAAFTPSHQLLVVTDADERLARLRAALTHSVHAELVDLTRDDDSGADLSDSSDDEPQKQQQMQSSSLTQQLVRKQHAGANPDDTALGSSSAVDVGCVSGDPGSATAADSVTAAWPQLPLSLHQDIHNISSCASADAVEEDIVVQQQQQQQQQLQAQQQRLQAQQQQQPEHQLQQQDERQQQQQDAQHEQHVLATWTSDTAALLSTHHPNRLFHEHEPLHACIARELAADCNSPGTPQLSAPTSALGGGVLGDASPGVATTGAAHHAQSRLQQHAPAEWLLCTPPPLAAKPSLLAALDPDTTQQADQGLQAGLEMTTAVPGKVSPNDSAQWQQLPGSVTRRASAGTTPQSLLPLSCLQVMGGRPMTALSSPAMRRAALLTAPLSCAQLACAVTTDSSGTAAAAQSLASADCAEAAQEDGMARTCSGSPMDRSAAAPLHGLVPCKGCCRPSPPPPLRLQQEQQSPEQQQLASTDTSCRTVLSAHQGKRRSPLPPEANAVALPLGITRAMVYVRAPRVSTMPRGAKATVVLQAQAQAQTAGNILHDRQAFLMRADESCEPEMPCATTITGTTISSRPTAASPVAPTASTSATWSPLPDGAGSAPTLVTLECRVRVSFLDMRLAREALAGAAWAALDLSGLPLDLNQTAQYEAQYAAARSRLVRCRPVAEVAAQDRLMEAEWEWLRSVRMRAAAAAQAIGRQGILRRGGAVQQQQQQHEAVVESALTVSYSPAQLRQRGCRRVRFYGEAAGASSMPADCALRVPPAPLA